MVEVRPARPSASIVSRNVMARSSAAGGGASTLLTTASRAQAIKAHGNIWPGNTPPPLQRRRSGAGCGLGSNLEVKLALWAALAAAVPAAPARWCR
jgi:hypothetical protein